MGKLLYLDCQAGMSGNMFLAALLDAGASEARWLAAIESLGLAGVGVERTEVRRSGIRGLHVEVTTDEHHPHRGLPDVLEVARSGDLSDAEYARVKKIFTALAEAEAEVHGISVEKVHFHEVGALDAIVDVVSAAVLLEDLAPDRVMASPIRTGRGTIKCEHGLMPVPAPATALLLRGLPAYAGDVDGEFLTPTGAAILKASVDAFGPQPVMTLESVGHGAGTKEPPFPNLVRALVGESDAAASDNVPWLEETLLEVEAHIDDMTGEDLGTLSEILLDGPALDVAFIPVTAKKSRPGQLVRVLAPTGAEREVLQLLFHHSTTLGARVRHERRVRLERETLMVTTAFGEIAVKRSSVEGKDRFAPEHDHVAAAAKTHGASLDEVRAAAVTAARGLTGPSK